MAAMNCADLPEDNKWRMIYEGFDISGRQHMRARELQAEHFVDEISLIADDGRNDFMETTSRSPTEASAIGPSSPAYTPSRTGRTSRSSIGRPTAPSAE
jgi:hypothetical protein